MYVFDGKNWISSFGIPYFQVLPRNETLIHVTGPKNCVCQKLWPVSVLLSFLNAADAKSQCSSCSRYVQGIFTLNSRTRHETRFYTIVVCGIVHNRGESENLACMRKTFGVKRPLVMSVKNLRSLSAAFFTAQSWKVKMANIQTQYPNHRFGTQCGWEAAI